MCWGELGWKLVALLCEAMSLKSIAFVAMRGGSFYPLNKFCSMPGQGFVTKDRRKPHVRQADEELAAALEAGTISESEAEDEAGAAAQPSGGITLDGLVSEAEQFEMLVHTMRVLVRTGQAFEAQQLTEHVTTLLSRRGADK